MSFGFRPERRGAAGRYPARQSDQRFPRLFAAQRIWTIRRISSASRVCRRCGRVSAVDASAQKIQAQINSYHNLSALLVIDN